MDKEHMLAEIKRTAEENGGMPLGRGALERETGIRQGDWYPHHWLRWGDALREAAYAPNQLKVAFPEESVIEKLISLIRELGPYPVAGELRLKRRDDASFPSHGVFNRIGSKAKLVAKVVSYCDTHPGFEDVPPLCPEDAAIAERAEAQLPCEGVGFVYLMKWGERTRSVDRAIPIVAEENWTLRPIRRAPSTLLAPTIR